MPIPISYPLINGHRYSWNSVELGLGPAGIIMRGVSSIDYGDQLTPGNLRGTGPNVVGRTRGEYDADAEIEMYRLEWENLKGQLGSNGVGFERRRSRLPCSTPKAGSRWSLTPSRVA